MSKKLAIIGSGDLAKLISFHAGLLGYDIFGYFDDFAAKGNEVFDGKEVKDTIDNIEYYENEFDFIIIGIGYKYLRFRKKIYNKLSTKFKFLNIIHKSVVICSSVQIGDGNLILPGCVFDDGVNIGNNNVFNTGVIIAHDTSVSSHSFYGPGVNLAGFVVLGECCFFGINSTIIDNITICDDVQTGGGAVITKNIMESGLYLGVPATKYR